MMFVFDAYGTLFDVHSAVSRHRDAVGPQSDQLSQLWRSKQLEYAWVRTLLGRYLDFWTLTVEALDSAAAQCGGLSGETRSALLSAYETPDVFPDVIPALARLRERGHRTAILSNATFAMLAKATAAAGLDELLDGSLSVESVGVYKPGPRVYRLVYDRFGERRKDVTFVSSNRWDVAGAAAYGFKTVWLNRLGLPDEYADLPPRRVIGSLDALP